MPYIPGHKEQDVSKDDRASLDPLIKALVEKVAERSKAYGYDGAFAGQLNYCVTSLGVGVMKLLFPKIRYWLIALFRGTLRDVGDEFYRRMGAPYEDKAIEKAGDIDVYMEPW